MPGGRCVEGQCFDNQCDDGDERPCGTEVQPSNMQKRCVAPCQSPKTENRSKRVIVEPGWSDGALSDMGGPVRDADAGPTSMLQRIRAF